VIREKIKICILNNLFDVLTKLKKYYCKKCERYHHRGKIYQKHLIYKKNKQKKAKVQISRDINPKDVNFEDLRPIAKRQILSLLKRMTRTEHPEYYKKRIMQVIVYENKSH
jgi:hypothetical protein